MPDQASPLADAWVFNKVKAGLGGRVRLVCSGAAPLAGHVEEFLKVAMCAPVCQGYGLTETCGSSFIALPEPVRCVSRAAAVLQATLFLCEDIPCVPLCYQACVPASDCSATNRWLVL